MSLVKKKTGQSNSGFIYANQSKGKPINLMPVSQPQTRSSSASSSTSKKRSQVIEKFVESIMSATKGADDIIHQTATSIKRNNQFLKSFSEGGLNIIQSFTLKQVSHNYKDVLFGNKMRNLYILQQCRKIMNNCEACMDKREHIHPVSPMCGIISAVQNIQM